MQECRAFAWIKLLANMQRWRFSKQPKRLKKLKSINTKKNETNEKYKKVKTFTTKKQIQDNAAR